RSIFCSATAFRLRSGSTAPTRGTAANSAAAPISRAGSSAKAWASRSGAATICCGRRSTGRCSGSGKRVALPTCGYAIFQSARSESSNLTFPCGISSVRAPEIMMSAAETAATLRQAAELSNAWPFEEAKKIVARLRKRPKDEVIFETGYGPSGLPHIGTFGEVARTTMVRHAFRVLTDDKIKTRLIAFSDDMDGLRKVPDNVPNREMLEQHLGKPLTAVPDPFGTHPSFGEHNNARLRAFLDKFGFEYEFMSSTQCYTSGRFDAALLKVLQKFDAVMGIMLPSLREERAATYSPFLPIDGKTGIVLQVPVVAHDAKAGTITYEDPDTGKQVTTPVTGGRCKLQWKPDWAMRWVALGVDYEMAGKDLIDSVKLSGEICRALGGQPPEGFNYEL